MSDPGDGSSPPRRFAPPAVEVWRLDLSGHRRSTSFEPVVDHVVERLEAVMKQYVGTAERVGRPLGPDCLRKVLLALRIESRGGKGRSTLADSDRIGSFLRESLFDEILDQAGTIQFKVGRKEGSSEFLPLERTTWRRCLDELEARAIEPK